MRYRLGIVLTVIVLGCSSSTTDDGDVVDGWDFAGSDQGDGGGSDSGGNVGQDGYTPVDTTTYDVTAGEVVPPPETVPLFLDDSVIEIRLTMASAELESLLDCWRNPPAEVLSLEVKCWVSCDVEILGQTFDGAECRPKGTPENWLFQMKPQFVVRFDGADDDARFFGMRRLNLEANADYGAPIRDRLAMWLMRETGVHASRVAHAHVTVNDENYGVYQSIEPIDDLFLAYHFGSPVGNLYDDLCELKTNNDSGHQDEYFEFMEMLEGANLTSNLDALQAKLLETVDMDAVLDLIAVEIVLPTVDNVKDGGGNLYTYQTVGGKFLYIPWDMDDAISESADVDQAVDSCLGGEDYEMSGSMCEIIHAIPTLETPLYARVRAIIDSPSTGARLTELASEYCELIVPFIEAGDPAYLVEEFEEDCADIGERIVKRLAYLDTHISEF